MRTSAPMTLFQSAGPEEHSPVNNPDYDHHVGGLQWRLLATGSCTVRRSAND